MKHPTPLKLQSEEVLRQKIEAGSHDPEDYRRLIDLLIPKGKYDEVVSLYRRLLNVPLTNLKKSKINMELGWNVYEMGLKEEAETHAEEGLQLLSREPESGESLAVMGANLSLMAHCLWTKNESVGAVTAEKALHYLERATEFADLDERPLIFIDLARVHLLLGNTLKAIVLCEDCLEMNVTAESRLSCLLIYSDALQTEKRFSEAEPILHQILREVKEHKGILPGVYLGLGLIQRFASRLNEAGESFQKAAAALEADPYLRNDLELRTWIYRNNAEIHYETGRYDQSAATYRKLLTFVTTDDKCYWDALMSLANCYHFSGAYGKAAECFEEVQDSPYLTDSERTAARGGAAWNRAKCCYDAGDFEEAIEGFEDALRSFPLRGNDHSNTLLWLGYSCWAIGAYERTRECLEGVVALADAALEEKAAAQRILSHLKDRKEDNLS